MRSGGGAQDDGRGAADLVGVRFDAELVDVGQAVVERPLVPEAVLRAADAAVSGWIGKLVPPFQRTVEHAL